eukprot:COSAG06_NODE_4354_length_4336_cov_1.697191_3_plen_96_part_00
MRAAGGGGTRSARCHQQVAADGEPAGARGGPQADTATLIDGTAEVGTAGPGCVAQEWPPSEDTTQESLNPAPNMCCGCDLKLRNEPMQIARPPDG